MVKLIRVKTGKTYEGKDGKVHDQYNYYLQTEQGSRIAVKPSFKDDYKLFFFISVEE